MPWSSGVLGVAPPWSYEREGDTDGTRVPDPEQKNVSDYRQGSLQLCDNRQRREKARGGRGDILTRRIVEVIPSRRDGHIGA